MWENEDIKELDLTRQIGERQGAMLISNQDKPQKSVLTKIKAVFSLH